MTSGEGRLLPVPSAEILFEGGGHLDHFRQKLAPCCYQLLTANLFLLKLVQPSVPQKQNKIFFKKNSTISGVFLEVFLKESPQSPAFVPISAADHLF